MDALVMCGGAGTRLGSHLEKPLVPVGGRPTVDRVVAALRAADGVGCIRAAPSPTTPATRDHLSVPRVDTPGEGYVDDLRAALDGPVEPPVLTVAADLPLLPPAAVETVLDRWAGGSATVAVPVGTKRALGVSVDATVEDEGQTVAPCGLNVVADAGGEGGEDTILLDDPDLAVNVNRPADLAVARRRAWRGAAPSIPPRKG